MSFDPIQYKTTTREQWEDAAEAWHRWGPTLETWLGEATETMLDAVGIDRRAARCSTSPPAPVARPSPPPAASGRTGASSPPTSRRRSSPMPRRRPRRPD